MGKQWKQCQTLFLGGSKITADGDCRHEIKRRLLLGRKVMTNLLLLLLSRSVVSDSVRPHRQQPTRLLCPWDFPGNSTGVDCHFLLQGIFPTQGSNPGLLHCRQTLTSEPPGKPLQPCCCCCCCSPKVPQENPRSPTCSQGAYS